MYKYNYHQYIIYYLLFRNSIFFFDSGEEGTSTSVPPLYVRLWFRLYLPFEINTIFYSRYNLKLCLQYEISYRRRSFHIYRNIFYLNGIFDYVMFFYTHLTCFFVVRATVLSKQFFFFFLFYGIYEKRFLFVLVIVRLILLLMRPYREFLTRSSDFSNLTKYK